MIRTEDFLLPAHWASYLINGDATSLSDDEQQDIDEWCITNAPGPCIAVDTDNIDFTFMGDDVPLGDDGPLGADRCAFTFQIIEVLYSDGEPIGYTL